MFNFSQVKRNLAKKPFLVLYFLIFILFWLKGVLFLDPDFGWRLRGGGIYASGGIPAGDPFTYTMPSFPWVDHAWFLSLAIAWIYSRVGYVGLAGVFSVVSFSTLFVVAKHAGKFISRKGLYKNTEILVNTHFFSPFLIPLNFKIYGIFVSFPFWLATSILLEFSGIRVQVVSWLMLAVLIFFLFNQEWWTRLKIFLPFYFLIWANLHGGFVSGLITLLFFLFLKSIREKAVLVGDFSLAFASLAFTLINPYGVGVWREVWSSFSDAGLRWKIAEWMPSLTLFDLAMVFLMGTSSGLILKYRKNFLLEEKGLYLAFLLQALSSRRHLPLWVIITVPLLAKAIFFLLQDAKKVSFGKVRFALLYKIAWLGSLGVFVLQTFFTFNEAFFLGLGEFYPKKAVSYLQANLPPGEIFSSYSWGGYLIWKLPEKRVFIDGRMPSWRWEPPSDMELSSAFDTYNDILKGKKDYKPIFEKFNTKTVLWSIPPKESPVSRLYDKLENYLTLFGWEKSDFELLEELEKDGWQKVYQDEVALIYRKFN